MKRLIPLALVLALLALPFGALAEENYEAANYETLKQVHEDLKLDYRVMDEYLMTGAAIHSEDDWTEYIYVDGFAWDTAVEFDAYFDFLVPQDRIADVSVLLTWLNYAEIWHGHAYLNRERARWASPPWPTAARNSPRTPRRCWIPCMMRWGTRAGMASISIAWPSAARTPRP